ncbi:plasmid mobilization protein, partial [Azospirillum brasilense]|uniref:plasmid mobilization protein n=1 Tax=Azospirillum brasilense TaxID=192 RepID=UPI001B3B51B9
MNDTETETPTRRDQSPIKVRALPDEREILRQKAEAAGLSLSAFLLTAGLGAALPAPSPQRPDPERAQINRARRTQPYLKVRPFPDERAELELLAASAGLPVSEFLLSAGLGATIKSVVDLQQVATLSRVNADQGRVPRRGVGAGALIWSPACLAGRFTWSQRAT